MPDYEDSLASSLLNPGRLDDETEQWMTDRGMSEDDKARMRAHQALLARRRAAGAGDPTTAYTPGGAVSPIGPDLGLRMGLMGAGVPSEFLGLPERFGPPPDRPLALEDVPSAVTAPLRTSTSIDVTAEAPPEAPPSSGGSIGVRWVDGKPVFTNVGGYGTGGEALPLAPEQRADYTKGVQAFRDEASIHDAAVARARELGLMPKRSAISATGIPRPQRDFTVRQKTPIGASGVSQPFMADPTQELTSEDWASMGPLAQEKYAEQVGMVGGIGQTRAATKLAEEQAGLVEHERKMGTDLDYLMARRAPFYQKFIDMAKADPELQNDVRLVMENYSKLTGAQPGTPDYAAKEAQAWREGITKYLASKHQDVAQWDDVLSRNIGLTI